MRLTEDSPISGRKEPGRGFGEILARWFFGPKPGDVLPERPPGPTPRFRNICIGREAGAGGSMLGRSVAARLGWKFYDAEILETIARRMETSIEEVKILDELAPSTIQDWVLPLREEHYAPLEAYLDHLAKLILSIGHAGDAVIIGRGAGFMLPRSETLSVRLVAPLKARAALLAERMGVTPRTARRMARDLDRRRDKFVRTMFRVDATDPHHYDLVLDLQSIGLPIATEILARAIESGQPQINQLALPAPQNLVLPEDEDEQARSK